MKFGSKRTISRILAASMLVTSAFSNVFVANADVAATSNTVASGAAVTPYADGETWVYATDVKTALPDGLDDGAEISENISIWNYGSTFKYKTNALVFNNGEYTAAEEFQIGKGNANVAAETAKGDTIDLNNIEKALIFKTTGATDITVYAGIGSSGVENANIILVDSTGAVVDAGTIVRPGGAGQDHTVPTLTAPAAGQYYLLQTGNLTSLNVGAIKMVSGGVVDTTTTTEATTETTTVTTTEETTTEATTTAPVEAKDSWIYATDVKAALPDGLDDGAKISENISIWNYGSTFKYKENALVFNNGEYTAAEEFQIGKGNANVAAETAKGDTIDLNNIEKALIINATGKTEVTVYAGIGSSGVENANIIIVDSTGAVVDAGTIVRPGGAGQDHTVPTLTIPAAGQYYLLQPGNLTSLNVAAIKMSTVGSTPVETTTEATTVSTTETTTEATTVLAEDEIAIAVNAVKNGSKVNADFVVSGNADTKGFNNYTMTLTYDSAVLAPVAISDGDITLTATDAAGNTVSYPATGKLDTTTNKIAFTIDGALNDNNKLVEYTGNGILFSVEFNIVGTGSSEIGLTVDTINTVSSNDQIVGALKAVVTPATVEITDEPTTVSTTETTTETTTVSTTEATTETTTLGDDTFKINGGNVTITPGTKEVKVPVYIDHNVGGFCTVGFNVQYDATALKLKDAENGVVFENGKMTKGDFNKNPYTVSFSDYKDTFNNGVIVTLVFDVLTETEGTYDIDLIEAYNSSGFFIGGANNENLEDRFYVFEKGSVVIAQETTTTTEATTVSTTEATTVTTTEATTEATTVAPTTEGTTVAPTTEATTEATTVAPTTDATTETTTAEATETTTRERHIGGGSGSSSYKPATTTTTEATTEATTTEGGTEATTTDNNGGTSVITKDVKVTIGQKGITIGGDGYGVDVAPYIQTASNSTLVPLRVVSLAILGGNVEKADSTDLVKWDGATKTATIIAGNDVIEFVADSDIITINGSGSVMENGVKAEIKDARMYVPFRALGKALGVEVKWDAETKTATYVAPSAVSTPAEEETTDEEETVVTKDTVVAASELGLKVAKFMQESDKVTNDDDKEAVNNYVTLLEGQIGNLNDETLEFSDEDIAKIASETAEIAEDLQKIAETAGITEEVQALADAE